MVGGGTGDPLALARGTTVGHGPQGVEGLLMTLDGVAFVGGTAPCHPGDNGTHDGNGGDHGNSGHAHHSSQSDGQGVSRLSIPEAEGRGPGQKAGVAGKA